MWIIEKNCILSDWSLVLITKKDWCIDKTSRRQTFDILWFKLFSDTHRVDVLEDKTDMKQSKVNTASTLNLFNYIHN